MITKKRSGHIVFQFENEEEYFELGNKVLIKQHIEGMIPCIRVQYNLRDRIMYDIEQYEELGKLIPQFSEVEAIKILKSLITFILEIEKNGFIPCEAVQVGSDMIFYDKKQKKAFFIVLPIAKEYDIGDYRNWQKRIGDTIYELLSVVEEGKADIIKQCFEQSGKLADNMANLLPILESYLDSSSNKDETKILGMEADNVELQLIHNGMYGQFAFYIRKQEFVIGKNRSSVDGYLGVSGAVSRLHCKIRKRANQFYVSDMGSSNHTFVNGTLVKEQEEKSIHEGDILRIADIDFTVHITMI